MFCVDYVKPLFRTRHSLYKIPRLGMSSAPVYNAIRGKLESQLNTQFLEVRNESYMHNVPKGAETHFKVIVVSEKFDKLPLIKRHRMVNEVLNEELKNGVHALSIVAKTPKEYDGAPVDPSPNCRGGFGR